MPPPTVLIAGLGLMGGSLAAALAQAGWRVLLHHRRPEVATEAERRGWGRAVASFADAADADLAVVCVPVGTIPALVRQVAAATGAVVTDVGSAKAAICSELADLGPRFVGSHPMCGSHLQGLAHADPALYRGRLAIVTPTADDTGPGVAAIEALWRAAGCRVLRLTPADHDRAVAMASHLPHALACAAAAGLDERAAPVAATGFRDTTRIAGSDPELWADILLANADAVGDATAGTEARLARLRAALAAGDRVAVAAWLAEGREGRRRFERIWAG